MKLNVLFVFLYILLLCGARFSLLSVVSKGNVLKLILWPKMVYFYKVWLRRTIVSLTLIPHILISIYLTGTILSHIASVYIKYKHKIEFKIRESNRYQIKCIFYYLVFLILDNEESEEGSYLNTTSNSGITIYYLKNIYIYIYIIICIKHGK